MPREGRTVFEAGSGTLSQFVRQVATQAVEQALERTGTPDALKPGPARNQIVDDAVNDALAANSLAVPSYGGGKNGNPITFLVKHYWRLIEAGGFFQSDLKRIDAKLLQDLKNAFRHRDWRKIVKAGAKELRETKLPTVIRGQQVATATKLADVLPPRRNLEQTASLVTSA